MLSSVPLFLLFAGLLGAILYLDLVERAPTVHIGKRGFALASYDPILCRIKVHRINHVEDLHYMLTHEYIHHWLTWNVGNRISDAYDSVSGQGQLDGNPMFALREEQ